MRRTRPTPAVRLGAVSYDQYVRLRNASENRGLRMAYHDGILEIMSPEYLHDRGAFSLSLLIINY